MNDRTVHARGKVAEVVRYERAGEWYIETVDGRRRTRVPVQRAAEYAAVACSEVYRGIPGGSVFDRLVELVA